MRAAVSIPDEIFEKVERLAAGEQRSRSDEVYSAALREYVARHAPDENIVVLRAMGGMMCGRAAVDTQTALASALSNSHTVIRASRRSRSAS